MMDVIRSSQNPRVVAAARLARSRERSRRGEILLEGPILVRDALAAGVEIRSVFALEDDEVSRVLADQAGATWLPCAQNVISRLGSTETPRGPVAVASRPASGPLTRDALVADLRDPGNAGTLIRTAAAFGFDVGFPPGAVDVWSPKVLRSAAGAHFKTSVLSPLEALPPDIGSIATVPEGGVPLPDVGRHLDRDRRWAILVGSEPHGLAADVLAMSDVRVTIPMPGGTESLNAAVAGAVVAYQLSTWRADVGSPTEAH